MARNYKDVPIDLFNKTFLSGSLFSLDKLINVMSKAIPEFKEEVSKQDVRVQMKLRDDSYGRMLTFRNGTVTGKSGIFPDVEVEMIFEDNDVARRVMMGEMFGDTVAFVNAAKQGQLILNGPDEKAMWFSGLLLKIFAFDVLYLDNYGTKMPNGEIRYTTGTNGGPLFVYVKNGKIVRTTPIDFDETDAKPWTIKAKGKKFTPPKRTTASPHAMSWKSLVYSPDRILYPMKRVDFDPNGERNYENRGVSGYERISWEEALDIVSKEIVRVRQEHGPGAVFHTSGSHHTWGNCGYYLSAAKRFFNCIGATCAALNPDSWEGFAWGAVHHYGGSARNGGAEPYSTVEDCMQN